MCCPGVRLGTLRTPAIAPSNVLHCKIEELDVQADNRADDQQCKIAHEACGLPIQASTRDASVGLVQSIEPKSEISNAKAQSSLEQLKIMQQLDEDSISTAGFAFNCGRRTT